MSKKERMTVKTVRMRDSVWSRASSRAVREGVTMSTVLQELVEGYSLEKINLPRIEKVYT